MGSAATERRISSNVYRIITWIWFSLNNHCSFPATVNACVVWTWRHVILTTATVKSIKRLFKCLLTALDEWRFDNRHHQYLLEDVDVQHQSRQICHQYRARAKLVDPPFTIRENSCSCLVAQLWQTRHFKLINTFKRWWLYLRSSCIRSIRKWNANNESGHGRSGSIILRLQETDST